MPSSVVKSFAEKAGVSVAKVESMWDLAKKKAEEQGEKDNYAYITAIVKRQLKLENFLRRGTYTPIQIAESKLKPVELFLGRFQPLHNGHATVIGRMHNPVVALVKGKGSSTDKERNPLSAKDQLRLIKKVKPGVVAIEVPTGYVPDIGLLLREKGMELTAVYAGDDRKDKYAQQFESFNKKHPDEAFDIKIKPTFDPTAGRIGGTSATLVRKAIRDGDEKTFKEHMPKALHSEWDFLRSKIK